MARVRPFPAWRYARPERELSAVIAPPYDVISPAQRDILLARDPHNVVALELPDGPLDPETPGNRYATGRALWDEWRAAGVLRQDPEPCLYVLEQRFELFGSEVSRKAVIVEVGIEPLEAGVVIPHERTLPKALGDRFELIRATGANLSQVFGLFDDPESSTDVLFERVMASDPLAHATDDDGVMSTLWGTTDAGLIEEFTRFAADRRIFIADGHHRYTTALAYRDLRRVQAQDSPETHPAYDHVMMALVNMDDPDLAVLGYHRIADAPEGLDPEALFAGLSVNFEVSECSDVDVSALQACERAAFLFRVRGEDLPRVAVLRDDVDLDVAIPLEHSSAWKELDVAVLQELILWPLLGIHPDRPETLDRIRFTKDASEALASVDDHDVAFVLRPTRLDQLKAISLAGEIMPQKSTYFYPKLPSGLVIRSAE